MWPPVTVQSTTLTVLTLCYTSLANKDTATSYKYHTRYATGRSQLTCWEHYSDTEYWADFSDDQWMHIYLSIFFLSHFDMQSLPFLVTFRQHCGTTCTDAAYCYRPSSTVSLWNSVARHSREPCKNGWIDQDAVWVVGSGGMKDGIRWVPDPHGKRQY